MGAVSRPGHVHHATKADSFRASAADRAAFRAFVLRSMGPGHPVYEALRQGPGPTARSGKHHDLINSNAWDATHLTSRQSGEPGRLALELRFENRYDGVHTERYGVIMHKTAVDIGGIAVETRTAIQLGLIGSARDAPASPGWVR